MRPGNRTAAAYFGAAGYLIFAAVAMSVFWPDAFAASDADNDLKAAREKLKELRADAKEKQALYDEATVRLPSLDAEIKVAVKKVDDERDKVRKIKQRASVSWEAAARVQAAEDALLKARADLAEKRQERDDLLKERSTLRTDAHLATWRAERLAGEIKVNATRAGQTSSIGVYISQSCLAVAAADRDAGRLPACPTYADFLSLDTSLPGTGEFRPDPNRHNHTHRGPSPYTDVHRLYWNTTTPLVIIDPPGRLAKELKMVYIEVDLPLTAPETLHHPFNKHDPFQALPLLHTRIADRYCVDAVIGAAAAQRGNWSHLLIDTIDFMRAGCDANTSEYGTTGWLRLPAPVPYDRAGSQAAAYADDQERQERLCHKQYGACAAWPPWSEWLRHDPIRGPAAPIPDDFLPRSSLTGIYRRRRRRRRADPPCPDPADPATRCDARPAPTSSGRPATRTSCSAEPADGDSSQANGRLSGAQEPPPARPPPRTADSTRPASNDDDDNDRQGAGAPRRRASAKKSAPPPLWKKTRMSAAQRARMYPDVARQQGGEYCVHCNQSPIELAAAGRSSVLCIDHDDNDPSNNDLRNLQLLCHSCNTIKNHPRAADHDDRPPGPEMAIALRAVPKFRAWLFQQFNCDPHVRYPLKNLLNDAAEECDISQETCKRYLGRAKSRSGMYDVVYPMGGGAPYVRLRLSAIEGRDLSAPPPSYITRGPLEESLPESDDDDDEGGAAAA